jgi:glycosyltransferase involved in cell wall biosynthesis
LFSVALSTNQIQTQQDPFEHLTNPMAIRIVFVITDLAVGGAEMMLLKLLEQLSPRFVPHVISLTRTGDIGQRIVALGIPVEAMEMRSGTLSPAKLMLLTNRLRVLRPDVVHTWMYHADLVGGIAARLAGVRAVSWGIHHTDLSWRHNKIMTIGIAQICAALSYWVPSRVLVCSEAARQSHIAVGYAAAKMHVLPNGFDVCRFQPDQIARVSLRKELGLHSNALLVGNIGRFHKQKNHRGFFATAAKVGTRIPEVHFLLAGIGIQGTNAELMRMVVDTGIADRIHLLGLRNDIPRILAALDVLASSSHGEAFPNVLGEAMACGVPCAVTAVGDSADILADTGRVVESSDMDGLAAAIQSLLALPASERRALGERARERVKEEFDLRKVVKRYEAYYEQLVTDKWHPKLPGSGAEIRGK